MLDLSKEVWMTSCGLCGREKEVGITGFCEACHYAEQDMAYALLAWGSHPRADNDDCHWGQDFDGRAAALEAFHAAVGEHYVEWFELDGVVDPEIGDNLMRRNPAHDPARIAREERRDRDEWRQEIAMQAGMGLGVEAYNDAMGW